MSAERCTGCDGVVYIEDEEFRCANCEELFHKQCLSEEGEDGLLCISCGTLCKGCNMVILSNSSEHECS